MSREAALWGAFGPLYVSETGTFNAAVLGAYLGQTAGVPAAPTIGTAAVVDATHVNVPFTAPADDGVTIIDYTATSNVGGFTGTLTQAGSGTVSVVGAFVLDQAYTFTVVARNANGTGPASAASNSVTPNASGGGGGGEISIANGNDWKESLSGAVTFDNPVTVGNVMIAGVGVGSGPSLGVDDADGPWSAGPTIATVSDNLGRVAIFYKRVVAGQDGTTPTATLSGGFGIRQIVIIEVTGNDATVILDGTPTSDRGTGPGDIAPGDITPTRSGWFVVLVAGTEQPGVTDGVTTVRGTEALTEEMDSIHFAYGSDIVVDTPAPFGANFSYSDASDWWAAAAIFKAAEEGEEPPVEEPGAGEYIVRRRRWRM